MGNTIKRQFLTAAVISLFVLGSVGVASAGTQTTLTGTFKGKLWCGLNVADQAAQTDNATKTKIKDDVSIDWDFSLFPEINAVLTDTTTGVVFTMAGISVRTSDKKGFFILNGSGGNFQTANMQGKYKNDTSVLPAENVPTSISGKFTLWSLTPGSFGNPAAIPCASETGSFKAKGDGMQF